MNVREPRFEGVLNLRDLGGYSARNGQRVRWGRLYRSMSPEWMSSADVARAHSELGIRLVIDLRGPERTSGPLGEPPARRVPIDVIAPMRERRSDRPDSDAHAVLFPWLLPVIAPALVSAMEAIAAEPAPTLFHCHTGKDRTGFLAALILGALGVSDEDIMADYLASNQHYEAMHEYLEQVGHPVPEDAPRMAREPSNEAGMRAALEMVKRDFGGFSGLLEGADASDTLVDRLAEVLLESAD